MNNTNESNNIQCEHHQLHPKNTVTLFAFEQHNLWHQFFWDIEFLSAKCDPLAQLYNMPIPMAFIYSISISTDPDYVFFFFLNFGFWGFDL